MRDGQKFCCFGNVKDNSVSLGAPAEVGKVKNYIGLWDA